MLGRRLCFVLPLLIQACLGLSTREVAFKGGVKADDQFHPKHHMKHGDGKSKWVNRNDVDWEACHPTQVMAQSGVLDISIEDDEGVFHNHHSFLYRCAMGPNPFYLRYTLPSGGSVMLKMQWPDVLDENYLFSSKEKTRDDIGYGFRIAVCSDTKDRFHYRRFFFNGLGDMNKFIQAQSTMMSGMNTPTALAKEDFFKAPRYHISRNIEEVKPVNQFGDHYVGISNPVKLLRTVDELEHLRADIKL